MGFIEDTQSRKGEDAVGTCGERRKWSWVSWMGNLLFFFKKMDHSFFLFGRTGFFVALRGLSLVAASGGYS